MRALRLAALAALALLASPVGAALPQLALGCSSVPAGQPASCTITRLSGGQGVYVTLQTSDGSAKAGTDYTATKKLVYLKGSVSSASVAISTFINPNAAGTLTFNALITAGAAVVRATGSIIEPAPAPQPVPPAAASCPSITNPAWFNGGPIYLADEVCTATKVCSSLWRSSASDAAGVQFPKTIIGVQYYVNPMTNGLLPSFYSGPAVNGVPTDGAGTLPNWGQVGDWQFDPSCFQ